MAGARGYHNYRGRRSKGKIFLAVLLVLVILAAVAVMLLQKNIVYDETGTPRLEIPWREEETPEEPIDLDLVIQEPVETEKSIHGFFTPVPLTRETWSLSSRQAEENCGGSCNAMAVTLKDSSGSVYFDSAAACSGAVRFFEEETDVALEAVLGYGDRHTVACLSCFHDPKAANSDVEGMGLKNTGGFIFYDGKNSQWLDPAKPAAREYLCALAKEAAALGFDEILLTDVSYPTEGKLDKIAYGENGKSENILLFLEEMRVALEPYSVALSIEVPASVITEGREDTAGLVLAEIAPKVDRIYAAAAPEEVEQLASAVTAASAATAFVPELTVYAPVLEGNWMLVQS